MSVTVNSETNWRGPLVLPYFEFGDHTTRIVVEQAIVRLKKDYPSWGAPKIRERLKQKLPGAACPPKRWRCRSDLNRGWRALQ